MDFAKLRTKAAEQSEARTEAFRKHLAEERERESKSTEKMQDLFSKLGDKIKADTKAAAEAEINNAIEQAKTEIRAEYAQKHGVMEYDEQYAPLKKMLGNLAGLKE